MRSVDDVIGCDVTLLTSSAVVDDVVDDVIKSCGDVTVVCVPVDAVETVPDIKDSKKTKSIITIILKYCKKYNCTLPSLRALLHVIFPKNNLLCKFENQTEDIAVISSLNCQHLFSHATVVNLLSIYCHISSLSGQVSNNI